MQIIALFKKRNIEVQGTLIDPSSFFIKNCKNKARAKGYNIETFHGIFENFSSSENYDLILLIHSYFTFKNDNYAKKMKKLLSKEGIVFIIGNDSNSFLAKLKKTTDKQFISTRREIGTIQKDLLANEFKLKIKKLTTKFPTPLKNNRLTNNGKLILSWICLKDYSDISPDIIKRAKDIFVMESKDGRIHENEVLIKAAVK